MGASGGSVGGTSDIEMVCVVRWAIVSVPLQVYTKSGFRPQASKTVDLCRTDPPSYLSCSRRSPSVGCVVQDTLGARPVVAQLCMR